MTSPGDRVPGGKPFLHLAANHHRDDFFVICVFCGHRSHDSAVPKDGDVVSDAEELLHLVRDVEACDASFLEVEQDAHEDLHLGFREGGGWLVEDQHLRVLRKSLRDFHDLLLAHAEIGHDGARVDAEVVFVQNLLRLVVELVPIDEAARPRLAAEVYVLPHGHAGNQSELLVHDGNAFCDGLAY